MFKLSIFVCIEAWALAVMLALPTGLVVAEAVVSCPCWNREDLEEAVLDTCAGVDQVFCEHTTAQSGLIGFQFGCINSSSLEFGEAEAGFRPRPTQEGVGVCTRWRMTEEKPHADL
jgi:hypothetical protein